jgi:hypothetical protein
MHNVGILLYLTNSTIFCMDIGFKCNILTSAIRKSLTISQIIKKYTTILKYLYTFHVRYHVVFSNSPLLCCILMSYILGGMK